MGVLDDLMPTTQEDHEEAYAEGKTDGENPSIADDFEHLITDTVPNPIESETNPDYEAGYHSNDDD